MNNIILTEQEKLKNCLDAFDQNGPFSHFKVISGGEKNQEELSKINDTITDYTNYVYMSSKSGINDNPTNLDITVNQNTNIYDYLDDDNDIIIDDDYEEEENINEEDIDNKDIEINIEQIVNYDNEIGDTYYEEDNYYDDNNEENIYIDFE